MSAKAEDPANPDRTQCGFRPLCQCQRLLAARTSGICRPSCRHLLFLKPCRPQFSSPGRTCSRTICPITSSIPRKRWTTAPSTRSSAVRSTRPGTTHVIGRDRDQCLTLVHFTRKHAASHVHACLRVFMYVFETFHQSNPLEPSAQRMTHTSSRSMH